MYFLFSLAFQEHISSNNAKYRKSYRLTATSSSSTTLCSGSLDVYMSEQDKHPASITCNYSDSIISHVNVLRRTLPLSYALRVSLGHVTFILVQNLSSNMSSWNLASLACLLFKEIPLVKCSVSKSMAITYSAVSPRLSFPVYSGLHSLECSCKTVCSSLHKTYTYFQVCYHDWGVSGKRMGCGTLCVIWGGVVFQWLEKAFPASSIIILIAQETLEEFYKHFQSVWAYQCAQVLKSSFPKVKHWKNIRHKGTSKQCLGFSRPRSYVCILLLQVNIV